MEALQLLGKATGAEVLPPVTRLLVELRASQLNGCSACVDMHSRELEKLAQVEERIFAVGAWRHTSCFEDAERVALVLTESLPRLSDDPDPVSDELWARATRSYDERTLCRLARVDRAHQRCGIGWTRP